MKIEKNKVVCFHYTLRRQGSGDAIETSDTGEPVVYLHGHDNILPALEAALEGKSPGDEVAVSLTAEQAYGAYRDGLSQRVPIKHLITKGKLKPGMAVKVNTADGPVDARVLKVGRFNVDLDLNHPLAGMDLDFAIQVESVREADAEEVRHGHAHGVGGHQH